MGDLVSLAVKAIFVENLALSFFFGYVHFHSCFKEDRDGYRSGIVGYGSASYYSAGKQFNFDLSSEARGFILGRLSGC